MLDGGLVRRLHISLSLAACVCVCACVWVSYCWHNWKYGQSSFKSWSSPACSVQCAYVHECVCICVCVYLHATRIMRLSSMAPPENQGLVARQVSSALSFSEVTFSVRMLVVMLASCKESITMICCNWLQNCQNKDTHYSSLSLSLHSLSVSLCTALYSVTTDAAQLFGNNRTKNKTGSIMSTHTHTHTISLYFCLLLYLPLPLFLTHTHTVMHLTTHETGLRKDRLCTGCLMPLDMCPRAACTEAAHVSDPEQGRQQ